MRRVVLVMMVMSVAVGACGPRRGTPCGNSTCSANEICDQALKLCVANVAPQLIIDSPTAHALIGAPTFELRGSATDDQGTPPALEYAIEDAGWAALEADDLGAFSVAIGTPNGDGEVARVKVRATDATNNVTERAVEVRFDRQPPRCELLAPSAGGTAQSANTLAAAVEASVEDGSAVTAELSTDDGASWAPMTVSSSRATYWWTLPRVDREARKLRLRAADAAGNSCSAGPQVVYVDTVAPSLSVTAPADGFQCGGGLRCTVSAQIGDSSGQLPRMYYQLNSDGPVEFDETVASSFVGDFPPPNVDYTPYRLTIIARDEAGNETSQARNVFVDHLGPVVTFLTPEADQVFNAAAMADAGMKVTISWSVTDRNPDVAVQASVGRRDAGTFAPVTANSVRHTVLVIDDGDEYVARVHAENPTGASTLIERRFKVDVVHPTFDVSPPNGARMTERAVRMAFNEPTTFANPAQALSFDAGGPAVGQFTVLGDGGYAWTNLTPGTVYRATLAPRGQDRAGNFIEQIHTWSFFTNPVAPDSGTILITDAGTLSAAFDQDGVVTFADSQNDSAGNLRVRWFDIDPVTANVVEKQSQLISATPTSTHRTAVSAWAAVAADGTTTRKTSLVQTIDSTSTGFLRTSTGYFTQHDEPGTYVLPGAVAPELPRAGLVDYGLISPFSTAGMTYSRPPNADIALPFPGAIALGGELSFMVWRVRLTGTFPNVAEIFERRTYHCASSTLGPYCDFNAGGLVNGGVGDPSVALTPTGRAVFVSTKGGQTVEHCAVEFRQTTGPCSLTECMSDTRSWTTEQQLSVYSAVDGDNVMGIRKVLGNYEVIERDTYPCDSAWTTLFTMPISSGSRPIPVRFGTTRAALYRDSAGNVRVLR